MTITFESIESTHDSGDGVHVRHWRSVGATEVGAFGTSYRLWRAYGTPMAGSIGPDVPEVPALGLTSFLHRAGGDAISASFDEGAHERWFSGVGFGGAATDGAGIHARTFRGVGLPTLDGSGYAFVVTQPMFVSGFTGMQFEHVADGLGFSEYQDPRVVAILKAAIAIAEVPRSTASSLDEVNDDVRFSHALSAVWGVLLEEGILLTGDVAGDAQKVTRVVSRLLLSGASRTYAEALAAVSAGLVFGALTDILAHESITDQVQIQALVSELFTATERLLGELFTSADAITDHTAVVLLEESMDLAVNSVTSTEFAVRMVESIGLFFTLAIDDGHYVAWVLNTDSRGLSRYANYPFNSFMKVGGAYYGITSTGLYKLEGDDDAGAPIAARLRLGMSDLGTRKLKRIPEGFIGYTSDGALLLQVITSDEQTGEKVGTYYTLAPRGASNVRENRWKIGRGLKSVDWDFEITNVDGADFEIDAIAWRPLILDRRTRG